MMPNVSINNGIIFSLAWNSPDWTTVLEWDLGNDKIARFLRAGDQFLRESVVNGKVVRESFEQQPEEESMSPDEIIAEISKRQAYINDDGTIDFLIKEKSQLNNVEINERQWGVTIVDLGESQSSMQLSNAGSVLSWGGHAVVVIETIEEDGIYHMRRADIVLSKKDPKIANVRYAEIFPSETLNHFDVLRRKMDRKGNITQLPENLPRTKTWIRTKFLVQKMIAQIEIEKECYEKNHPIVFFNALGIVLSGLTYNCMGWSKKCLDLAHIRLPSNCFIPTPSSHTRSFIRTEAEMQLNFLPMTAAYPLICGIAGLALAGPAGSIAGAKFGLTCSGLNAAAITSLHSINSIETIFDGDDEYDNERTEHSIDESKFLINNEIRTIFTTVQQNGLALKLTKDEFKNNEGIVYTAVRQNGLALQFASDTLRNNKRIVLAAIRQNGLALQFARDAYDKWWREALFQFRYSTHPLKWDHPIVLIAVQQNGLALQFARDDLKNDRQIVLTAVRQNGLALQFANNAFKNDLEIVLAAVSQNGLALQFASDTLKNDAGIAYVAVRQDGLAFEFVSPKLKNDHEIAVVATR